MAVFQYCLVCTFIMLVVLRFIMRSKVASNIWEQHGTKNPISKWFLWNVRRFLPPVLFWFHLLGNIVLVLLSVAYVWVYKSGYFAESIQIRNALFVVTVMAVGSIEAARNYNRE